jgi:1-acyl-sn-glycerol-3-phosphate acyltransferase
MLAVISYYWRTLVTIACFVGFALSGVVFSVLAFPMLCLVAGERRHVHAKRLIHHVFSLIVRVLRATGCMRLQTEGVDKLRSAGAVLVLANHPTYLDVVVLLSLLPAASCVVKSEHWDNPIFGGILRAAGYIRNSDAEQLVDDCAHALERGAPLIVFPQGTRSNPDAPMKFLRGAAHIALKSGKPIVPVLLQCEPLFLTKGAPWYLAPPQPFQFRVVVRDALRADTLADTQQTPVIAARRLTNALECYFSDELSVL